MPSPNDPIDITLSPTQILMNQFNVHNKANLALSDFIFSLPVTASVPSTPINTKVTLTPVISSGYYTKRDFYYQRVDVADLFNNDKVEITFTAADTMLSDIIDQVNEKYGINLIASDYTDVALPTFASLGTEPNPSIVVSVSTDSYIYVGTGNLVLGSRVRTVDDYNYVRNIAVITESEEPLVFENDLILLGTDYKKASYFKIFRNTVTIDKFRVDKVFAIPGRNFYLKGEFEFSASLNGDPLQDYVVEDVIIDTNGTIVKASSTPLFGNGLHSHYGINKNIASVYLVDLENLVTPDNAARLYKYDSLGVIDPAFAPALAYEPVMARVGSDGKILTVSPQFTGPIPSDPGTNAKQIRIDRLNIDGTIDATFNSISIRSTGTTDVAPVLDIIIDSGGGGFVCFKPIHGLTTSGSYPIVNDVPFVVPSDPTDCAFNPVFRFNQSGGQVLTFSTLLTNNTPNSVMIDSLDLVEDQSILSFAENKLIVITNRNNPITGFTNRSAMSISSTGVIQNIAPDKYIADVRWDDLVSFNKFENGRFVISGMGRKKQTNGGWSNPEHLMASYNQSGQLTGIVYTPLVVGVPNASIIGVSVLEWLST